SGMRPGGACCRPVARRVANAAFAASAARHHRGMTRPSIRLAATALLLAAAFAAAPIHAETRLERWRAASASAREASAAASALSDLVDGAQFDHAASVPRGVRAIRDVSYGADRRQRLDVYVPAEAADTSP